MRKKLTKIIALVLATMMVLGLAGCGDNAKSGKVTTITAMFFDRGEEYAAGYSLTDNLTTRWINEQLEPLGVKVEWIPVPRSGSDNQINVMLTGNTAPDVIRTYDRQRVGTYASQGGLMDLTPYMDKLDKDYLETNAEAIEWCKFDGKQYALPGVYGYHGKSNETYIRQDLVEAMGMKMPTNKEELIDVLYAAKEAYPDMQIYGFSAKNQFTMYTTWLLSETSRADERINYMYEPTATIALKPGHENALKELNQFYLDGIIDPAFIEDVDMAKYEQDIANGNVFFVADDGTEAFDAYATAGEGYKMVAIDCIENLDGSYEVPSQDAFSHYVYVPKTAEKKMDAVATFLGWLSNAENAMNIHYSVIGVGADLNEDGFPVKKSGDELVAMGNTKRGSDIDFLYSNFEGNFKYLIPNFVEDYPGVTEEVAKGKIESQYSNYFDKALIGAALKTDEYVPNLQSMIPEFVFKCISAPEGKFDEVYKAEYQKLVDNHLQEVLDERAAWYDANMK